MEGDFIELAIDAAEDDRFVLSGVFKRRVFF